MQTAQATEQIAAQIAAVQTSTTDVVDAIGRNAGRMQDINRHTSAIAASVQQQNSATAQISRNVEIAAIGTNAILLVLEEATAAITKTGGSAETMLTASQSVETAAANLRDEVEGFLRKVSA